MAEYKMLGEFVTHCTKCKLDLNHRITLMDGSEPARVLCLTCQTERKFRKTRSKEASLESRIRKIASAKEKSSARQSFEEEKWRRMLENENVTPKRYNINETFKLEDRIYHQKFGMGLVIGFDFPDKVHVFFDDGVKVLKGNKATE